MIEDKVRTMFFRRASWANSRSNTLEHYLKEAHNILDSTEKRVFTYNEGHIQGLHVDFREEGLCCHVTYYIPDQSTSLVPIPSDAQSDDISVKAPPRKHNYMENDIFFVIKEDTLVLCLSGAREGVATAYIEEILESSGNKYFLRDFEIVPVANIDKIKIIQQEGVKKVLLNASLYEASVNYIERRTVKQKFLGGVSDIAKAIFENDEDPELRNLTNKENISVKLELSYNSKKKDGLIGKKRIIKTARKLIEDDKGFKIVTGKGSEFTEDEIRVKKKVKLPVDGKSVRRDAAFNSLLKYLDEIKRLGIIAQ